MPVFNPIKNSLQSPVVVALLLVLFVGYSKGHSDDKIRVSVNDFERSWMMARMWVAREQLKFSKKALPSEDEQQFWQVWEDVGKAASKVDAAWERAIEADPLIERALECLDRSNDLTMPYNTLRNTMRNRHGRIAFGKFEKEGETWLQCCGMQWLDLDDRRLLRLYLRCGQIMDSMVSESKKDDDNNIEWRQPYGWLARTHPVAAFHDNSDDVVTEEDAIKVWREALQHYRDHCRNERNRLRQSLKVPDELWLYLRIRQESDSLGYLGFTYLQVKLPQEHAYIAEAEEDLNQLFAQAHELCPSLMQALGPIHRPQIEQDVERLTKLHEQLLSSVSTSPRELR